MNIQFIMTKFWLAGERVNDLINSFNRVCSSFVGCPGSDSDCCNLCAKSGYHGECEGSKCCCDGFLTSMQHSTLAICS